MEDPVIRIPPYHYVHVLDLNSNVTRVEVGPHTYIRQDHERWGTYGVGMGGGGSGSPPKNGDSLGQEGICGVMGGTPLCVGCCGAGGGFLWLWGGPGLWRAWGVFGGLCRALRLYGSGGCGLCGALGALWGWGGL
uniref:Uncharacterized protein n=1 Tax=Calidris pygmaea TaxID=425635 RepID=A0A8C3K386_9CHAR